jgi:hypothetical protein
MRPRVEIDVSEVVLRGVPPEQAPAVLAALRERLAALALADHEAVAGLGDRAETSRRLRPLASPAAGGADLGMAVADAVWADFVRPARHEGCTP